MTVAPRTNFLVSNDGDIVACIFPRFAANNVKGRQVAIGNGASCPWKQHNKVNVGTWSPYYSTGNFS